MRIYPKPDLHVGDVFGQLTVEAEGRREGHGGSFWTCKCSCGNSCVVATGALLKKPRGQRMCGLCNAKRRKEFWKTHGLHRAPEYSPWKSMHQRCADRSRRGRNYFGRGITVCDQWKDIEQFILDVGPRPSPKHSLERLDNNKGYEPGNVEWATSMEQGANKRSNHMLTIGEETLHISEWARRTGLDRGVILRRVKEGLVGEAIIDEIDVLKIKALGKSMTPIEWSEETGLRPYLITQRIRNGWSTDDAVTAPVRDYSLTVVTEKMVRRIRAEPRFRGWRKLAVVKYQITEHVLRGIADRRTWKDVV